jgi:hypothetical protein
MAMEIFDKLRLSLWSWLVLFIAGLAFATWSLAPRFDTEDSRGRTADWSILTSTPDLHPLLGSSIVLRDVLVAEISNDKVFWGSAPGGKIVFVTRPAALADLKLGQTVQITGTVHPMPRWEEARSLWDFEPALKERVEEQRLYLAAERIDIAQQP